MPAAQVGRSGAVELRGEGMALEGAEEGGGLRKVGSASMRRSRVSAMREKKRSGSSALAPSGPARQLGLDLGDLARQDCPVEALLGRKVAKHHRLGDPRRAGQLARGGALESAPGEQPHRGFEDRLPALGTAQLGRGSTRRFASRACDTGSRRRSHDRVLVVSECLLIETGTARRFPVRGNGARWDRARRDSAAGNPGRRSRRRHAFASSLPNRRAARRFSGK